jgi:predicted ATPase
MVGHGVGGVRSPVLVGRDEFLALADRRLAAAAGGQGHLLLVAGEAGIGKTRLLASIARRAQRHGLAVVRAAAFPGDAEESGGLLLDLAGDLRQSQDSYRNDTGVAMSARLRELATVGGDRHRQRRLLVQDLTDALSGLGGDQGSLVVFDDLHWADELSFEVAAHLATRLDGRSMMVAGAYRSDELYPRVPLRGWRARLLTQRLAEEIRLPRLTSAQTATMTSAVLGRHPHRDRRRDPRPQRRHPAAHRGVPRRRHRARRRTWLRQRPRHPRSRHAGRRGAHPGQSAGRPLPEGGPRGCCDRPVL